MQKWRLGSGRSFSTSSSWSACWQSRGRPPSWSRWICPPPPVNRMSMYLQRNEMIFFGVEADLKNVLWLRVANLFCNLNLLKNSQEMLRNDWLACMMARMIISASSFASAWKVINYQECPHTFKLLNPTSYDLYLSFFYQQVCTSTCWSGLRPAFIPRISSMIFSASTWEKKLF